MTDIVEATGVHKPSLYRTFGTKEEMFATVLRRYLGQQIAGFNALVEQTPAGIAGVHAFLGMFTSDAMAAETRRHGCLIVAASSELHGTLPGFEDFAKHYRAEIRTMMQTLVRSADAQIGAELVIRRADLLTTFLLGHLVIARAGATDEEINRSVDAVRTVVDTW